MIRPTAGVLLLLGALACRAEMMTPVWVELGEGSAVLARVIIDAGDCPLVQVDGASLPMTRRLPVPDGFLPLCEATLPANARSATVNGRRLPLPNGRLERVVVMGDSGCRIQGALAQACNDPAAWPFQTVARLAAKEKPSLVVHVGDYLYREDACPADAQARCGGSTKGDNWETWRADFFAPAAELLAAAPWAVARGNHESCQRAWRGWFYYLDPRPWRPACEDMSAAYTIQSVEPNLVMFDSAATANGPMPPGAIQKLAGGLTTVGEQRGWLVAHHPVWGIFFNPATNKPEASNPNLEQAWKQAGPAGIDMILSGHMHLFELLSYGTVPVQIVAGIGGTLMDSLPTQELSGVPVGSATVMTGAGRRDFGYTLLTRRGRKWDLALKNVQSRTLLRCTIHEREAACPVARR